MSAYPTPELFRHFPELRERLPWVALARATPVDRLARLESFLQAGPIWVKRDDLTSPVCGGDKARKLEFLFGDLLRHGSRRVLAFGAVGSSSGVALTAFANQFRLRPLLALVRSARAVDVQRTLEVEHELGAELHRLDGGPGALWRLSRSILSGRRDPEEPRLPYVVRPGRAAIFSALGYVNAAYELRRRDPAGASANLRARANGVHRCRTPPGVSAGRHRRAHRRRDLRGLAAAGSSPPGPSGVSPPAPQDPALRRAGAPPRAPRAA
jgi:D-cysteine desulfhydrase